MITTTRRKNTPLRTDTQKKQITSLTADTIQDPNISQIINPGSTRLIGPHLTAACIPH